MYKIAIVEDNVADAATIEANIENYFNLNGGSPVDVDKFTDGLFFIENYRPDYDIVMLDIQMPLLDGMRTAAKLREIDETMSLVFITNMAQFAIQGYEVNACGYLLKPIKYGDIEFLLKRLIPQIMRRRPREIVLRYNGVIKKIDVTDLYYVEVNAHYVTYHTNSGDYVCKCTMRETEEQLRDFEQLVRCSNSFIVNLRYVEECKNNIIRLGDAQISLSRSRRIAFKKKLAEYMGS